MNVNKERTMTVRRLRQTAHEPVLFPKGTESPRLVARVFSFSVAWCRNDVRPTDAITPATIRMLEAKIELTKSSIKHGWATDPLSSKDPRRA